MLPLNQSTFEDVIQFIEPQINQSFNTTIFSSWKHFLYASIGFKYTQDNLHFIYDSVEANGRFLISQYSKDFLRLKTLYRGDGELQKYIPSNEKENIEKTASNNMVNETVPINSISDSITNPSYKANTKGDETDVHIKSSPELEIMRQKYLSNNLELVNELDKIFLTSILEFNEIL